MTCKVQSIPPSRHPEYYQSLYYNRFFRPPYWRDLLPLCHLCGLCHFSCAAQERIADERRRIMQPPSRPLHFIAFIIGQDKSLSVRRRSVTASPTLRTLHSTSCLGLGVWAGHAKRTQRKWTTWQTPGPRPRSPASLPRRSAVTWGRRRRGDGAARCRVK